MLPDDAPDDLGFRRPTESDYPALVAVVDEWWGGRRMQPLFQRLWFQHFAGTSWLAELSDGRPAGFLVGFISPADPTVGYVKLIATNPNIPVFTIAYGNGSDLATLRKIAQATDASNFDARDTSDLAEVVPRALASF